MTSTQLPPSLVLPGEIGRRVPDPNGLPGAEDPRSKPLKPCGVAPAILCDCYEIRTDEESDCFPPPDGGGCAAAPPMLMMLQLVFFLNFTTFAPFPDGTLCGCLPAPTEPWLSPRTSLPPLGTG